MLLSSSALPAGMQHDSSTCYADVCYCITTLCNTRIEIAYHMDTLLARDMDGMQHNIIYRRQ
jgi:hypothetical protein